MFFLVSGYIIAHILQTEHSNEFLIKRFFRIYPLYIVAVLIQYIPLLALGRPLDISILLPQLLLLGDFFATPYALNGVEWTRRVEIMFYVFMVVLRALGLMSKHNKLLPYVLVVATICCGFIAPIPAAEIWSKGYLTIYGPFLFMGVVFYLYEKKLVNQIFLNAFIALVFYQYFYLIAKFQNNWLNENFAVLAFLIFLTAWICRKDLKAESWILFLSEMTFSVYLFHNWLFDYIKTALSYLHLSSVIADIASLFILFTVCFFMVRFVEKPGIRLGRFLLFKPSKVLAN